jgi:hypothetical protein
MQSNYVLSQKVNYLLKKQLQAPNGKITGIDPQHPCSSNQPQPVGHKTPPPSLPPTQDPPTDMLYIDKFVFDCANMNAKTFHVHLFHKDFMTIKLVNAKTNGVYKFVVTGNIATAPQRLISGNIICPKSKTICRSSFETKHVQMNRTYLLTCEIVEELKSCEHQTIYCLSLKNYVANGALSLKQN